PLLIGLLVEGIVFSEEPSSLVVVSSVGAIIGMIPEGLVLLTSVVLAVSALRLAKQKTLVQDLNCIETLARVDVLCLDKTGTITEGKMYVEDVMAFDDCSTEEIDKAVNFVTSSLSDTNPTFFALKDKWNTPTDINAETVCPFSSAKKWSGAYSTQCGSYIIGAGEFILGNEYAQIKEKAEQFSQNGRRVILLAHSDENFCNKDLPNNIKPIALIAICDKIRDEAPETLKYFEEQGVDIKIISGDNPSTVSAIAMKAGVINGEKYIDASTVDNIGDYVDDYTVFGRVTPDQKLELVKALKAKGRTVGMTGDGVNDVLALKEADCSVAMQSGSESARNVSNFVLLDSNFASMPKVVAEGRRSINNVERSASLFLSKTVYNFLTAFIFVLMGQAYLFQPIQMTLINALCIGIPSFFLALEPNKSLVKGTFISNVMKKALPNGITVTMSIMLVVLCGSIFGFSTAQMSSIATIVLGITSFAIVLSSCKPYKPWMAVMLTFCASAFFIGTFMFASFFEITYFTVSMIICTILVSAWGLVLMWLLNKASEIIVNKFAEYKKTHRFKAVD
ncbi:MAG: HAD-IC family P-type ATPase, partial [Oscillospiraceae bacterium]